MDDEEIKCLYKDLLKIHPDATYIRLRDFSYGIETCFVLPSGEEMIAEEFIQGTPTRDWFKRLDEFLIQYPHFGGGDFNDESERGTK